MRLHFGTVVTSPIKLLHIVGDSGFGGGSIIVEQLATMARRSGWDVTVLASDPEFARRLAAVSIRCAVRPTIQRDISFVADLTSLVSVWGFIRQERFDIVHTHTSKGGMIGRIAARLAGVPVVVHTVHGFPMHEESSGLERAAFSACERLAGLFCDRVISVSRHHYGLALAEHIAASSKLCSIPNGISFERLRTSGDPLAVRRSLGLDADDLFIVGVGRLATQKGFEYLLDAVPLIQSPHRVRVVICGIGPLEDALKEQALRSGISDKVVFAGLREDVGDVLAAADMVVLPSLWEGLSIALLESMAVGRPVVTTTIASNREATCDGLGALLVPPKDCRALADAISVFAKQPEKAAEYGERARQVVVDHFTEERMLEAYAGQYSALLAAKGVVSCSQILD